MYKLGADGIVEWKYSAGGEMWGTLGPMISRDGMICFGAGGDANFLKDCKAQLHCLDAVDGSIKHITALGKQVQSRPAEGEKMIYVGDYDGCMYAIDKEAGGVKGKFCLEHPHLSIIEGSPTVVRKGDVESVIFDSWDGKIYSLTLSEGGSFTLNWSQTIGKAKGYLGLMGGGAASTPFVVDDVLYVGGPKGVYSLGVENGDVLWFYETSVQCGSSPTAWSGSTGQARIAIGCEDGYAYIFEVET